MKVMNKPFQMSGDDVTLLAMAKLRGSKKLSDTNVDCFIAGYKTCMDGLYEPEDMIPLLNRHLKDQQLVEDGIKMAIGYADLRRGYTEEEKARISRANEVADALKKLIEVLQKGEEQ